MNEDPKHWAALYEKAEFFLTHKYYDKQLNIELLASELMNQYRLGVVEGVCSQYRTIKEAPVVGDIPREEIKRAVATVTEARNAGKKVRDKHATAIKNLGDK